MDEAQRSGRQRLLNLMKDGRTLTPQQAAREGLLSERQARTILKGLHAVERAAYVSGWHRHGAARRWTAEYRLGTRPDAPKPQPLSQPEKQVRYRERMRHNEERADLMRALRGVRRRGVAQDTLAMSLMPWLYADNGRKQVVLRESTAEAAAV